MSEFTEGVLFLKKHTGKAKSALQTMRQPYILKELNEQWSAIFPENGNPRVDPLRGWMLEHSISFPIMFFEHAEDHGWEYHIFNSGEEIASLYVNYELSYNLYIDIVAQRYPNIDPHVGLDREEAKAIHEAVLMSDVYKQKTQEQFENAKVDQFAVFEVTDDIIGKLKSVVSADWCLDSEKWRQQVIQFKSLLNIPEMSWISYRYLMLDE